MASKIEIPSVALLNEYRPLVVRLRKLANTLGLDFGWHYLLDLVWILRELGADINDLTNQHILDAGAGVGILQWQMAEQGAEILSVDRLDRSHLAEHYRVRYSVQGLRPQDMVANSLASKLKPGTVRRVLLAKRSAGKVILYHQDLKYLKDIADQSQDAVVSVSALEHNPPEDLPLVVKELMRVIKPGGVLLATLCAGKGIDWFHDPSKGWCYTAESLRKYFDLTADTVDNYAQYDELLGALKGSEELRNHLARFYFQSGDNGMPWGKWDPQYQPVGVRKEK